MVKAKVPMSITLEYVLESWKNLLEKSSLHNDVKEHVVLGMTVLRLLSCNEDFGTDINYLNDKKFDVFFSSFPTVKKREQITSQLVAFNLKCSVEENRVLYSEEVPQND